MYPRRGVGCELHGDAYRVIVEGSLTVVVALQESNHRSVAEVYGGDNLHGRQPSLCTKRFTKLSYSLRPTMPLFSG